MTHMIRQQYVHVELNGTESDGLALQRRLPDLCQQWLTPVIEQTLERCAPPDGHLIIERLEIDVGTLTLESLEQALPDLVSEALEHAIREQVLTEGGSSAVQEADPVQHKTARQSLNEAFICFLETGSLPWSFRLPEGTHLEQALLDSWQETATLGTPARMVSDAILQVLASDTVRQRLVRQFSPAFLDALLPALSLEAKNAVDEIVAILRSDVLSPIKIKSFQQQLWQNVLADVATGRVLSARRLVSESWATLPMTTAESTGLASVLEYHWPGITGEISAQTNQIDQMESTVPTYPESEAKPDPDPIDDPPAPAFGDAWGIQKVPETQNIPITQDAEGKRDGPADRETSSIPEHPEAREGIYLQNAGIILLHPFLPRFFAMLNIADQNTLLQPERALCLLHFLATGQYMPLEYELVLPKLLCNIPLLTPVKTNLDLTDTEVKEAVVLLEAVIGHWNVLRNTSHDGLRGTFLLRPGKVTLRDDGDWLLQVESNSVDILLDQLPWGISMIKLPWMDTMLWVAWG